MTAVDTVLWAPDIWSIGYMFTAVVVPTCTSFIATYRTSDIWSIGYMVSRIYGHHVHGPVLHSSSIWAPEKWSIGYIVTAVVVLISFSLILAIPVSPEYIFLRLNNDFYPLRKHFSVDKILSQLFCGFKIPFY